MNTLTGYSKSTLTDKYVLTAAGGHLAVGNASNSIPLNNSTVNTNLNADLLDGKHATDFLAWSSRQNIGSGSPFQDAVNFFNNLSNLNNGGKLVYNSSGTEYTELFTRRNDSKAHGTILKWGYSDKYIRIIRMISGTAQSTDWEKISAGYADNADTCDGLHVHSGRNNEANKIVRTDASGYILAGWINTTSGDMGTSAINRIYCSNDGYIRYKTPANFFSTLANDSNLLSITVGSLNRKLTVAYATNSDTVDGLHASDFKRTWDGYAGKTYIGWIKIIEWTITKANHFSPLSFILLVYRSYNSPSPESYTLAFNFGWDSANIVLLNSNNGTRIIENFRVTKTADGLKYFVEMYVNTSYTTYQNTCYFAIGNYRSFNGSLVCDILSETVTELCKITTSPNNIVAPGYVKKGSSDSYVLLGGGGHKAIDSFQTTYDDRYVKKAGDTMTGLLTVSTRASHRGIKAGDTYINSIGGDLIFQNNAAIRFGGDSWDYNVWAGLKYVHSSKTISLGLADGTHFTANSALSGGTMQFPGINKFLLNGVVHVNSGSPGQFNDGIRLYGAAKDGKWSNINFGCDPNAASGTHANQWMIGRNTVNNFIIGAGSNYANTQFEIDPSGNVNIKGNTTLNGNLTLNASDIDRYITFNYTGYTNSSYSWRIGYLGSGNDDANYLVLQSSKTDGSWTNALRLGLTTLNANFSGLITATSGVLIGSTADIGWYLNSGRITAGTSVARNVNVGSLLVSSAWADSSKVPTNGIYSKGNVSAAGFVKTSSSDSYVLLGGGGHKLISDFAANSHTHDGRYLRWNGSSADVSAMGWGTLTSANGYTILSHAASSDGGDMGFVNKGGKIFMLLDGHYYQNEGKYRVLDTSDFTTFSNTGSLTTRITIGGVIKDLKVDADTVDTHHAGYLNNNVALLCPWPGMSTMKNAGFLPSEYGTSGYGHPDNIYLLAICKWAIATYSNLGDITLIGKIAPNSSGTCILHLYSSSGKDSSTLLPRYCSGTYTSLSGYTFHFGTVNYSWYYKREALTSDIPIVTDYYWANVPISNTSSNTTSPTFNIAAATRFSGELGDSSMTIKAERNNEINFGGTNNSATIYFGYRATGSKPIPTNFTFGSSTGTANIKANGFIKAGSNNTYVLLGGGSHKALSDFAMSSNYVKKAGDTLSSGTSQIQRAGSSVSWYLGRDNAMIRINSYSGYNVIASMKTTNGDWSLGVYSNNILYFTYFTDTNVSGKVNTPATQIFMNPSGHLYATHFYESSDINLKTNIKNINTADNMPILKSFDWKSDGTHSYGLIAQELEEQGYSELVETKEDGYKSVNYSAALSLIIGKLQVKIRELEKEIENLKNQN